MTLADYVTFIAIVECQSLTLAAEKLHLTKSAVSHAVTRIEEELRFPLFYRDRRDILLTEAAKQLLPYAYTVLRENDRFMEQVYSIQGLTSGSVTIGTCSSTCINWIPDIINTFRQQYPNIEVRVISGACNAELLQRLRNNEIDIAIASAAPAADLEIQEIYQDEMLCVMNESFQSREPGKVSVEELKRQPLILQSGAYGEESLSTLNDLGLDPTSFFTTYDDACLVAMVEGGLGYCVVGKLVLKSLTAKVKVYSFNPPQYRKLALIRRSHHKLSPVVKAMSKHIKDYVDNYPDYDLQMSRTGEKREEPDSVLE
ncbi:MAG: LysR family transcriptional regulator [Candidatus Onthomonas sp.]|nr:LysR family transcriptional regulator [Candidatus Onthomonas sp.]